MSRAALCAMAALLAACGAGVRRPTALVGMDRTLAGPVARDAQRDAPAAFAAVARAARAAEEAAPGPADVLALRVQEVDLALAWAAAEARGARARERERAANERRAAADQDTARISQRAAALAQETGARRVGSAALARAQAAAAAPGAVPHPQRATTAAELRQQTELALAAAVVLGAEPAARERVTAAQRAAEDAARGTDATAALVAAGRALTAAEALLRVTRDAHPPPPDATDGAQLLGELSDAGGLDPRRDARGVVAALHGLFDPRGALVPAARGRLETIARVIQQHRDARVAVEVFVGGSDASRATRTAAAQARLAADALIRGGVAADRVRPVGLHRITGGARSADVVEIVLLLPGEP